VAAWPPAVLPYHQDMPIPKGYRLESHFNRGLTYGGLVVWGVPYLAGLIAAGASGFAKQSGWLAVPVVGPFLAMGHRSIDCNVLDLDVTGSSTSNNVNQKQEQCLNSAIKEVRIVALLTLDGIMQTAGAIMTVAGLVASDEYLLRNDIFPTEAKVRFDAGYYQGQFRLTARALF
jgi:hypothetical protein